MSSDRPVSSKELIHQALDAAKATLEEVGCNCGDANDPPCALCLVYVALAQESAALARPAAVNETYCRCGHPWHTHGCLECACDVWTPQLPPSPADPRDERIAALESENEQLRTAQQAETLEQLLAETQMLFDQERHPVDQQRIEALRGAIAAMQSPAKIWDCRVCGFGVVEGKALDFIREKGSHPDALGNDAPNKGTAYCPYCDDETLRSPAALRAAVSGEGTWQPIATAPKDGTQVLLWIVGIEPRPRIGYWAQRGDGVGWYGLATQHFFGGNVTHWMPLPAAPQEDK